jgi:hypothetical protein
MYFLGVGGFLSPSNADTDAKTRRQKLQQTNQQP